MAHTLPLTADVLLTGGTLVTMDATRRLIPDGALAIEGPHIVWTGTADKAQTEVRARRQMDTRDRIIIPGLINAHSHLAMTLFRGLVDDMPLELWLDRVWQVESAYATAENCRVGTQLAVAEMIHGGVTCSADMYWQTVTNTEAATAAGFRLVNGPPMIGVEGPGGGFTPEREGLMRAYIEEHADDPLLRLAVQVHATYTASDRMVEVAKRLVSDYDLLFMTHASESKSEVETVTARFGKSPIEVLHAWGLLGPATLLAHCVHLRDSEIALLAETGTSVAHCPQSNLKIGNGVARVPDMLNAGINVALGTDGAATNNDLDMFDELRTAALIHKGTNSDPTVLPAEEAFALATINGARAVGLGDRIGSLEAGKLADLAVLDLDGPHVTPLYNIYSHLCYAVDKHDVRDVFIHGQQVMADRELLTLDEEAVKAETRRIAAIITASPAG
ncbi:MAG: amidohydrolase [Anaerolineae bacterium]|nr:amidohydrolase [Anaerolineae bacterium]